jgi:Domain of Unknown Function (DUF748)
MKRWKKAALITVGILLFLAGFIAFVLPGIVKSQAVQRVEAATGRRLAIGGISINPLTWTVVVRDFRFTEQGGGETFAAFSSARIAVSPVSLYRRAPVIAAAHISSPYFRVVRVGSNSYNFSDLLKWLPLHPRLSVNNLTISNGSVDFTDQALPAGKRHELRKVELAVPFITTMPYFADRYVSPRLSAELNGSPFRVEGKLRPFPRAVEASAAIELKDVSIPRYLAYIPIELPVRVESGRVSARITVTYRSAQKENPELSLSGRVTLAGMKVADRSGAPFLALTRLDAEIARARFLAREFDLSSLSTDGLEVFLTRDNQGVWSHSRLAGRTSPGDVPRRKALVSVTESRFRNGQVHFSDSFPPGGFATDLVGVSLDMHGYSTSPGKRASYDLSFTTLRGEKGSLKGEFSPRPLASSSSIELSGVTLEAYFPYLTKVLRARTKGRLHVAGNLDFGGPEGLRLDKVSIQGRRLSMPFGRREGINLASLTFDGGWFSRKENLLEVADVTFRDGELLFSRNRKGALLPLNLLYEGGKGGANGRTSKTPLRYRIGRISGSEMKAVFTDEMLATRPGFAFKKIGFSLEKLAGPPFAPIPFRLAGSYGKNGSLSVSGSVIPAPWRLKGELDVQRIPLRDFNPYLPENLKMVVAAGTVDARLAVSLSSKGDRLSGTFGGSAGIRSLYCLDADGKEFLKWESLQLDRLKWSLHPVALDIGGVALTRFHSRIVVEKDGRLNLQHLLTRKPEGADMQTGAAGKGGVVRIGTVTMQDGTLAFSDRHVTGGYSTTLFNLGGRISGLSSEENRFADLDLRGTLQNRSPLRITGQINPLRDDLFADLKVSFTDIELPPMTPYSATYLGYAVDRGQLSLDSRYRVRNRKIELENSVFIDQFRFGRRIESDKATTLPVVLAVALLKDRKGEIRVDIPVTGRTDDPHFRVSRVVLEVLKDLVVKASSSPLALLQSMFGRKEDSNSVGFAYGSAEISPAERDKLLKLATILNDRPALKIMVAGFVDRERDEGGYRNELLLKKMRSEKLLEKVKEKKNQPGVSSETVMIAPEEYSRYLKAVYAREDFPKPRNILGLIKALPDEEMKKLILANIVVGEQQLRSLAESRAAGVRSFLVMQGKMDSARVLQKSGDMFRAPAKRGESGSRVEFEVAAE